METFFVQLFSKPKHEVQWNLLFKKKTERICSITQNFFVGFVRFKLFIRQLKLA